MMKVYALMKWDFEWEKDELINVYRKRDKALEKALELAKDAICNRTNKDFVNGYDYQDIHYGYIVRWKDRMANLIGEEPYENEKMYYVREMEVMN